MTTFQIFTRSLFDSGDNVCRSYDEDTQADPIIGSLTFHHLILYISLVCMGICLASTAIIVFGHIFTYRQPRIQKNLIRIVLTAPAFAIFSAVALISYKATAYLIPFGELYEAFGLIAVFLLMVNLLTPHARTWEEELAFFSDPAVMGTQNFTKANIAIFQLLPVRFVVTIATIIVTAADCVGGTHYKRGHLIISIINGISTAIALIALFKFLRRFIRQLKVHDSKIVGKLVCFKLIVAVQFLQRIVLSILSQVNALNPTATLSYNDLNLGLGAFLTTIEATLIGLAMVWYYWHGPFRQQKHIEAGSQSPKMSPLAAVWNVIDLWDVIRGIIKAIKVRQQGRMQMSRQQDLRIQDRSYRGLGQLQYPAAAVQKPYER